MSAESEIFEMQQFPETTGSGYTDPVLVYRNGRNTLWRVMRNGKYFMVKTARDPFAESLLRREYDLSLNLVHPYLVQIWSFEETTPCGPGLVMEFVNGRTLDRFLAEKPGRKERERVFSQLLEAVSCIHHQGVIHNDLKPGNVLITWADNDVKLIDFGLADNDAHGREETLGRSRCYASPELEARKKTDGRSDLYSLGLILKDCCGHRFFRVVRRCTMRDPEDRYPDIDALSRAWDRRYAPRLWGAAFFAAFLVLLPSVLYVKEHRSRMVIQKEIVGRQQLTDSLTVQIQTHLDRNFQEAAERMGVEKDRIEQLMIINRYLGQSWRLMDTLHTATDDLEVVAHIDAFYNRLWSSQQEKLMELLEE